MGGVNCGDQRIGQHLDAETRKVAFRRVADGLVVRVEHVLGGLHQLDRARVDDLLREAAHQVVVDEVVDLRRDLHAGGACPCHHEREQRGALLGRDARERGGLEGVADPVADGGSVVDVFQEDAVLFDARNAKRVRRCTHCNHQHIIWYFKCILFLLNKIKSIKKINE